MMPSAITKLSGAESVDKVNHALEAAREKLRTALKKPKDADAWVRANILNKPEHAERTVADFWKAVSRMEAKSQKILQLASEGKTNAEIASEMGLPTERKASNTLSKAKEWAGKQLMKLDKEGELWAQRYILKEFDGATIGDMRSALQGLPAEQRRIIEIRLDGGTNAQIAAELKLEKRDVELKLSYAKDPLRLAMLAILGQRLKER